MPSLPRIRRTRGRDLATVVAHPRRPAELSAAGLTWIHLDAPPLEAAQELAERFGWHPLDVEDVLSKRQRPKVDDYADEGYLFAVLHFPAYDPAIQRLNAVELDVFVGPDYLVTLPSVELRPLRGLFRRCEEDEAFREQLFSKGSGRLLYEVLDTVRHSETLEPMTLYRARYGEQGLWVRPAAMFNEEVVIDGVRQPRFARL